MRVRSEVLTTGSLIRDGSDCQKMMRRMRMTTIKLVVPIGVVLHFSTVGVFEFSEEVFPGVAMR